MMATVAMGTVASSVETGSGSRARHGPARLMMRCTLISTSPSTSWGQAIWIRSSPRSTSMRS
jgi:hypothetical protein